MVKCIHIAALAASVTSALFTSPSLHDSLSAINTFSKRRAQVITSSTIEVTPVANIAGSTKVEAAEPAFLGIGFTFPKGWGPSRKPFGPADPSEEKKQWTVTYVADCGHAQFSIKDVTNARLYAHNFLNSTGGINDTGYPKPFPNTQGFKFSNLVKGPYYEYPLIKWGAWLGVADPGPDRVIINKQGHLAGEVTSYDAGSDGYRECRENFEALH